jgi:membrane associated rhomboid family serine protease
VRLTYNAPVTLTFAMISSLVLMTDLVTGAGLTETFFVVGGTMNLTNPVDYVRLISHAVGHASWTHLVSNFAFILLLGPILEEKYGSGSLLVMMVATALITGVLNVLLFPTGLLGASGIVFMMILLSSFTNFRRGEIPLTFVLVVLLYLTREIITASQTDNISQFAHIAGGLCGSLFGFLRPQRPGSTTMKRYTHDGEA